jgi:hypothetical protein
MRSPIAILRAMRRRARLNDDKPMIEASGFFDVDWYLAKYSDVAKDGMDPLDHYLNCGWVERRDPSTRFDTSYYLKENPDLIRLETCPLVHFLKFGRDEGREPKDPRVTANDAVERHLLKPLTPSQAAMDLRTAVVLHIYYADLAEELLDAATRIPNKPDILVGSSKQDVLDTVAEWSKQNPDVQVSSKLIENRGRNVTSWTVAFGKELLDNYDLFCHLHSKKSLYSGQEQRSWRQHNIDYLIGDATHAGAILEIFARNPEVGVIASIPHEVVPYSGFTWTSNKPAAAELSGILEIPFPGHGYIDFPAGNMFWARPAAVRQLIDGRLGYDSFPEEKGQNDGTLAHAIERAVYMTATFNGFRWGEVDSTKYWLDWSSKNTWQYGGHASYTGLLDNIRASETVSFSLFDTLLVRTLPDVAYVLDIIEAKLDARHKIKTNFKAVRLEAENRLRETTQKEPSYDEVYDFMPTLGLCREAVEEGRGMEFELDIASVRPRDRVVDGYNFALSHNKRVLIVADTLYTREQVNRILAEKDLQGCDDIYVPSERNARKSTGEMWKLLIEKENANNLLYMHVGHDEHRDVQLAHDRNIRAYHVLSAQNMFRLSYVGLMLWRNRPTNWRPPLALGPMIATTFSDPFQPELLC